MIENVERAVPSEAMLEARLVEVCACLRAAMQYIEYHCQSTEAERASDSRWQRWINASCLDASNAPRQPRRDSGVELDADVQHGGEE